MPQNTRSGAEGAIADAELSTGAMAGVNTTKGSGINLRGLGSAATLVLINGKRIAASSSGTFTDVSLIPLAAIERIEVLTDGASAIYGADAVAGVVNFILRDDYEGAETDLRYGFTTEDGFEEFRITQTLGGNWSSGNALAVLEYMDQSELSAADRGFTSEVLLPTSIFPENEQLAAVLTAKQELAEKWSLQADLQYAHSERFSYLTFSGGSVVSTQPAEVDRINTALSLTYKPSGHWEVVVDGIFSQEDIEFGMDATLMPSGEPDLDNTYSQDQKQDQWSAGVRANGTVFDTPGGRVGLAVGASHRSEDYARTVAAWGFQEAAERDVDSAFVEVHVPLVSSRNARNGVQALDLSMAARYDDYSDFGDTTNPKIGISWSPIDSVELRGSYSTSFRAPSAGRELSDSTKGTDPLMFIFSFTAPDGIGDVPIINLFGSDELVPEESENWTFGVTFRPASVSGLEISATYYDISYTDRIIIPPFDTGALTDPTLQVFVQAYDTPAELQAAIQAMVNSPVIYFDATGPNGDGGAFGPNPENQALYTYDTRWMNAGIVDISGFDILIDYGFEWKGSQFRLGLNSSYIDEIATAFAPGVPIVDLVDTTGNPLDWRLRGTASWSRGPIDASLALNYADGYVDTSGVDDSNVRSYTTVDANVRYELGGGARDDSLALSLSLVNLFDEQPPYVNASGRRSHYDGANASPLGRMVSIALSKRW